MVKYFSGSLWKFLCGFSSQKISEDKLYAYIQQAFFDAKKQPKLKNFFSLSFKKRDDEKPSTSAGWKTDSSKVSVDTSSSKEKTNTSENKIEINHNETDAGWDSFDEDIIPATPPPQVNKFKKTFIKTKSKLTDAEIVEKLPKTNIIDLIESIDGAPRAKNVENKEEAEKSFLAHIDNMSKKIKVDTPSDEENPEIIETSQEMAFESMSFVKNTSKSVIPSGGTENGTKATRKLISDYFQKPFKSS